MKTLIFNGSPRKNGGTSAMVTAFSRKMVGEVFVVETYRAGISPCVDCRWCWEHAGCAIEDPMQQVYRRIQEADQIILASPIYFAELTGSLLQTASRLQAIWVAKSFRSQPLWPDRPRRGALFLTDGGDGALDAALAMGKRLLRAMGAPLEKLVYCSGTDLPDGPDRISRAAEQAAALAVRWSSPALEKEIGDKPLNHEKTERE